MQNGDLGALPLTKKQIKIFGELMTINLHII